MNTTARHEVRATGLTAPDGTEYYGAYDTHAQAWVATRGTLNSRLAYAVQLGTAEEAAAVAQAADAEHIAHGQHCAVQTAPLPDQAPDRGHGHLVMFGQTANPAHCAPLRFGNYHSLLRWCATQQNRSNPQAHRVFINIQGVPGDPDVASEGDRYWFGESIDHFSQPTLPGEQLARLARLQRRYASYRRYLVEVYPGWTTVDRTHWMDNSVDEHQVDRWGNRRTVQAVSPHGDAC